MIHEGDVISAVATYLERQEYALLRRPRSVSEPGIDIIARKSGNRGWLLYIEAKGEGRSKEHTARYGRPFDPTQVTSCVSRACFAALRVVSAGEARAAIALPRTAPFESKVADVLEALGRLAIAVLWVDDRGHVTVESTWPI